MSDKNDRGESIHSDHRQRMWDRINKFGFESLSPHEQLEVMLYHPIPRGDTNEIAHNLISEFGSVYNVLTASPERLTEVKGVGPKAAAYLNSLMDITGAVQRSEVESEFGNVLAETSAAAKFCVSLFHGKLVEYLYIISLNSFKKVIGVDRVSAENSGQVSTTVAYIAKKALANHARYVVLAHNHPGGTLEPSVADLQMQRAVHEGLKTLQIGLEYNFIVAQGKAKCIFSREDLIGI